MHNLLENYWFWPRKQESGARQSTRSRLSRLFQALKKSSKSPGSTDVNDSGELQHNDDADLIGEADIAVGMMDSGGVQVDDDNIFVVSQLTSTLHVS